MIVSIWDVFALVLTIGLVLLLYFLIPVLIQLNNTLKASEDIIDQLRKEISPVINNVEGITSNVDDMTEKLNQITGDLQTQAEKTTGIFNTLKSSTDILKQTLLISLNNAYKYGRAFKVGIKTGVERYKYANISNKPIQNKTEETKLLQSEISIVDHIN